MKIALYYDGTTRQAVLTPETKTEREIIDIVFPKSGNFGYDTKPLTYGRGQFYDCQGGYARHGSGETDIIIRTPEEVPVVPVWPEVVMPPTPSEEAKNEPF